MAKSGIGVKYPHATMATPYAKGMVIIAGSSSPDLANSVARRLDVTLCTAQTYKDSSNETHVDIIDSVRGKDVFIIQSGHGDLSCNDLLMELLILVYACKTSSARKIIGVIPYLPYSKHCIMRRRSCITAKLLASMMAKSGLDHLVTMDLYHKEIQGFFDFPIDNLRASPFLIQYIKEHISEYKNGVIVARYPSVTIRASSFAERLRLSLAVIHGEIKDSGDGRYSPPPEELTLTPQKIQVVRKSKPPLHVVGEVKDKIAFIIDDIIDEVDGIIGAAQCIKENGAKQVYVVCTHAILTENGPQLLEDSCIDEVLVTNTIPQKNSSKTCSKLKTIDISGMLAEAVRRIYYGESMSYLFKNIPIED